MYRTPTGQESKLANMIRKSVASPCWPRETDQEPPADESRLGKAPSLASVPAETLRNDAT